VRITEAMINQQCAAKGFDAVETGLDETYSGSDGATGFNLTQANEVAYLTTLANCMHRLGLAWINKNPDDAGDNYATLMEPLADIASGINGALFPVALNGPRSPCQYLRTGSGVALPATSTEASLPPSTYC
jgi:hypothetical protein